MPCPLFPPRSAGILCIIDIDDSARLAKFVLHNGEPNDRSNLSEKWEGLTLVPTADVDTMFLVYRIAMLKSAV
ncbi:MAG: hypothetical protein WD073_07955 [Xanthobacteraceae bacterium]